MNKHEYMLWFTLFVWGAVFGCGLMIATTHYTTTRDSEVIACAYYLAYERGTTAGDQAAIIKRYAHECTK